MNDSAAHIFHKVVIATPIAETYKALTEERGLARWWTTDTRAEPQVGGTHRFAFNEGRGVVSMRVVDQQPNRRVAWRCVEGPKEWIDTDVVFDLAEEDGKTIVRFGHRNWKEVVDFMGHCSAKWAYFLLSLKGYLELGAGTPHPHDMRL